MTFIAQYRVAVGVLMAVLSFFGLAALTRSAFELTSLINGAFLGAFATIALAYWPLFIDAVRGRGAYDDVRQTVLAFFFTWALIAILVLQSAYYRAADIFVTSSYGAAFVRYGWTICAIMHVTAPDFGLGPLYGRDRKVLWPSVIVGVIVATVVLYFQAEQVLADEMVRRLSHRS